MNAWDTFFQDHIGEAKTTSLATMHRRYGISEHTCGECKHLLTRRFAGTYFKCTLYSTSGSNSTDWRKSWKACGKFEQE